MSDTSALISQLPALQVVLPLLAAPVCILIGRPVLAWALATLLSICSLGIALKLMFQVWQGGVISYTMGGWPPPFGIEYRLDELSVFVLALVSLAAVFTTIGGRRSIENEIPKDRIHLFYGTFLLALTGLLGIVSTGDAFNLFVFLEIASLSTYALVAMGRDRRALLAAFQYLILGTIGGTFILIGVGLLYMMTGTLNMQDIATRLPGVINTTTSLAALAFLVIGAGLKLALLPLHMWLPNAYTYAPSMMSAFLAATSTKVAAYVLIRFVYGVYNIRWSIIDFPLNDVLGLLAVSAMLFASYVAVRQQEIKRLLAWSSLAQIGYIVLGMSLATAAGLSAGILHILNHALIKSGLFMAVAAVLFQQGGNTLLLKDLAGLSRRMPWTTAAIVAGGLGLIGVPMTAGFVSKWALLQALIESDAWIYVAALLVSSLLAVVYVWRIVEATIREPAEASPGTAEVPLSMQLSIWALVAASLFLGLNSYPSMSLATRAAERLLGMVTGF